jgi:hypothetical protein
MLIQKKIEEKTRQGVSISIDHESSSFDDATFIEKILNRFVLIPLLTMLPKRIGTSLFVKSSRSANEIYRKAKSSRALEILYNFDGKLNFSNHIINDVLTYVYQRSFLNAKAARNRFSLVKNEILWCVTDIYKTKGDAVNVFSLASGSARAVIESILDSKKNGIEVSAKLLDLDTNALNLSMEIANKLGVSENIKLCNDKVSNFVVYCKNWTPDLVEMVGFLDYMSQEKAILLAKKIYEILPDGGYFVTCNIRDNYERRFVTKVLDWEMIYRNADDLADIAIAGGFKVYNTRIIYEPYLIHGLVVARK